MCAESIRAHPPRAHPPRAPLRGPVEHLGGLLRRALPREPSRARHAGGRQHGPQVLVPEQLGQTRRDRRGVLRVHQDRRVSRHLGKRRSVRGHHGDPGGERFQDREAEPLVARRVGEDRRPREQRHLVPFRHVARAHDPPLHPFGERRDGFLDLLDRLRQPGHGTPGDHERRGRPQLAERGDQTREVLARLDPTDEQDVRALDPELAAHGVDARLRDRRVHVGVHAVMDHVDAVRLERSPVQQILTRRGRRHDHGGRRLHRAREPAPPSGVELGRALRDAQEREVVHDRDRPLRPAGPRWQEIRPEEHVELPGEPFDPGEPEPPRQGLEQTRRDP